jgi:hypothetical protein
VVASSKTCTAFACSNAEIVGSNHTQGTVVSIVCVYPVFVLFCVQVAALRQGDPLSKESYRLWIESRHRKSGQGPTNGCTAIEVVVVVLVVAVKVKLSPCLTN